MLAFKTPSESLQITTAEYFLSLLVFNIIKKKIELIKEEDH